MSERDYGGPLGMSIYSDAELKSELERRATSKPVEAKAEAGPRNETMMTVAEYHSWRIASAAEREEIERKVFERTRSAPADVLREYVRHHKTCLKMMTYKNSGLDTSPCTCGLDAALAARPEAVRDWQWIEAKFAEWDGKDVSVGFELLNALREAVETAFKKQATIDFVEDERCFRQGRRPARHRGGEAVKSLAIKLAGPFRVVSRADGTLLVTPASHTRQWWGSAAGVFARLALAEEIEAHLNAMHHRLAGTKKKTGTHIDMEE